MKEGVTRPKKPIFVMCLYPRIIKNPKYLPNKKNGGKPPKPKDKRLMAVAIGCGKCIECRKQKAQGWRLRLNEEIKYTNLTPYFMTMTFSEKSLEKLKRDCPLYDIEEYEDKKGNIKKRKIFRGYVDNPDENTIATRAVRLFLERWRKEYGKSLRHWLITELGHDNTERIHLHGIIFTTPDKAKEIERLWSYGWTDTGQWCNEQSINYIMKYVTKIDNNHKDFEGKIFCSAGLGGDFVERNKFNKFNGGNTREYYKTKEGYNIGLPIYWRNKLWTDEQREMLWLNKINSQKIYSLGVEYDVSTPEGQNDYINALKKNQEFNKRLGYGKIDWKKNDYKKTFEKINRLSTK